MKNTKAKTTLVPLGDRVLVLPKKIEEKDKTASGIYLATNDNKEKPAEGKVIAVGPDIKNIKAGDNVIFSKYSYEEVKVDGEDYYILKEENIFAIIK